MGVIGALAGQEPRFISLALTPANVPCAADMLRDWIAQSLKHY